MAGTARGRGGRGRVKADRGRGGGVNGEQGVVYKRTWAHMDVQPYNQNTHTHTHTHTHTFLSFQVAVS